MEETESTPEESFERTAQDAGSFPSPFLGEQVQISKTRITEMISQTFSPTSFKTSKALLNVLGPNPHLTYKETSPVAGGSFIYLALS